MAYVEESRRPAVSRVVLNYLRVNPGPVDDVFLVKNFGNHTKEGIFSVIHLVKKLIRSEFTYSVNHTSEPQLIIRCAVPGDVERLVANNIAFKFDDQYIKIYKLASVSLLPEAEDTFFHAKVNSFMAHTAGIQELGYPVGYTDVFEDMEKHQNPRMSFSTMETLNIADGPVDRVFKLSMKYSFSPEDFLYVIRLVPFPGHYTIAVDQDEDFYLKVDREQDCELLVCAHFLVQRKMIKFYKVLSVKHSHVLTDKAIKRIYSRVRREDHWESIVV